MNLQSSQSTIGTADTTANGTVIVSIIISKSMTSLQKCSVQPSHLRAKVYFFIAKTTTCGSGTAEIEL